MALANQLPKCWIQPAFPGKGDKFKQQARGRVSFRIASRTKPVMNQRRGENMAWDDTLTIYASILDVLTYFCFVLKFGALAVKARRAEDNSKSVRP